MPAQAANSFIGENSFEVFQTLDLENLDPQLVSKWIKFQIEKIVLENHIANRLLYPQAFPLTKQDMQIDLAIFREVLRKNPQPIYDKFGNKIIIDQKLVDRFGSLKRLLMAIMDALPIKSLTTISIKNNSLTSIVGTIVVPQTVFTTKLVPVWLDTQQFNLRVGFLSLLGSGKKKIKVKIDGGEEFLAYGGELGVAIDLRGKGGFLNGSV